MSPDEYDRLRERIAAARAETAKPDQGEQPATPDELDVRDLGARANGKPYKGDPLATIADRMFRY